MVVGDRFKRAGSNKEYSINYSMNCNPSNVVYLITCKTCGLQYVGSTKTKFIMRFNDHKTRIRRHRNLGHVQRDQDDLIHKHFWGRDITDWRISRYSSLTESVMRRN